MSTIGQFHGLAESHDAGHVLRPGTEIELAVPPVHHLLDGRPLADVQGSYALGAVNLVGGHRDQICGQSADIEVEICETQ